VDRTETKKIIMELKALYPTLKYENDTFAVNAWAVALKDFSFHDIELAVHYYIATNSSGFPPSVNQLINAARKIVKPDSAALTPAEAWAQVYKVATETPYNEMAEAYKKLPKASRRALGSEYALMEIATMDISDAVTVRQSNFIRLYQVAKQIESEDEMLPPGLKKAIAERRELALRGDMEDCLPGSNEEEV
jgi:hypothetical protein